MRHLRKTVERIRPYAMWPRRLRSPGCPWPVRLPTTLRGDPLEDSAFSLPDAVATGLPPHLSGTARVTWLQLKEPFGYLGMVPWEALLDPLVRGPVLRLASIDVAARVPSADL